MNSQKISNKEVKFSVKNEQITSSQSIVVDEKGGKQENCCESGCRECLKVTFLCVVCACFWNRQ
jgi:hypothetical protein